MSDSECIDSDELEVVASTKSRTQSIGKFSAEPSTSTPIPTQPPPRSTFKSIILVLTVTFAMIINVGGLAAVA